MSRNKNYNGLYNGLPNYHFSIGLLGEESVGKSNLLENGRNLSRLNIHGTNIRLSIKERVQKEDMFSDGSRIKDCNAIIIVHDDNSESFDMLRDWTHRADRFGPSPSESDYIIVATRSNEDGASQQVRQFAAQRGLPFMEVSSEKEINELFTTLASKMLVRRLNKDLVREGERLVSDAEVTGRLVEKVFRGLPLYEEEQHIIEFLDTLNEEQLTRVIRSISDSNQSLKYEINSALDMLASSNGQLSIADLLGRQIEIPPLLRDAALEAMMSNIGDFVSLFRDAIREHPDNRLASSIRLICEGDLMEKIFNELPLYEEEQSALEFLDDLNEAQLSNLQEFFSAKIQSDTSSLRNISKKSIIDREDFVPLFLDAIREHPDNLRTASIRLVCEGDLMEKVFRGLPLYEEEQRVLEFLDGLDKKQFSNLCEFFSAKIQSDTSSLRNISKKSIIDREDFVLLFRGAIRELSDNRLASSIRLICEGDLMEKVFSGLPLTEEEQGVLEFIDGLDEEQSSYLQERIYGSGLSPLSDVAKKSMMDLLLESNLLEKNFADLPLLKEEKHVLELVIDGLDKEQSKYLSERFFAKIGISESETEEYDVMEKKREEIKNYLKSDDTYSPSLFRVAIKRYLNSGDHPSTSIKMNSRKSLTDAGVENEKESSESFKDSGKKSSGRS